MKLELVTWRDANFSFDDSTAATDKSDYLNNTVGWVRIRGRWLVIASEKTPAGPRAVTRVPLENVVKRKRLK